MTDIAERFDQMDNSEPSGHEWTQGEAASQLGIARQTLMRMEARGVLPKPRWRRKPLPHRVYNAAEIDMLKLTLEKYFRDRNGDRRFVEEDKPHG